MRRGQSTVELMVIVAAALVILAVLVSFTSEQIVSIQKQRATKTAELSVQMLVNTANELYTQGPGATRYLQLAWPEGVQSTGTGIQGHSVIVNVYGSYVTGTAVPNLVGTLPTNSGLQNIRVRSFDGFVMIGELDIGTNPTSILSSLARDTNSGTRVTITNYLSDDIFANQASIAITPTWSYPDVNLVVSPTSGTLDPGATLPFDVNVYASASAVGTYTGKITIQATFPSRVETLIIPVQVNVSVGTPSNLVVFPSSISMSTFGIDTNSTTIQLCNVSSSAIKNISITPSAGAPGSWITTPTPITTLNAQTCQSVDINASIPTDSISPYTGLLTISDYTGANTAFVPLTINVLGMSSVFAWDWNPAIRSIQTISDFALANRGRKPITISSIALREWWTCDSQHSLWNSMSVNNINRFIGSLEDGNTADVTDFTIPILTSYSNNTLTFSDNIQDQNEPFIADVNFSDGTQFTTTTFGTNCGADTTPPATIVGMVANSGPNPESVVLSFTIPGDDNYTGLATSYVLKLIQSGVSIGPDENTLNSYPTVYPDEYYTAPNQGIVSGGSSVKWTVSDLNVGSGYYFAIKFYDNQNNHGDFSNMPNALAWNRFSWSGNDFNFANLSPTIPIAAPTDADINQLDFNVFSSGSIGADHNISFRVVDDTNYDNTWIMALTGAKISDSTFRLTARIWYPAGNVSGIPATTPQYTSPGSLDLNSYTNLLSRSLFNTGFAYDGNQVTLRRPNHFYIDTLVGFTDFNVVFNNILGDEIIEIPYP